MEKQDLAEGLDEYFKLSNIRQKKNADILSWKMSPNGLDLLLQVETKKDTFYYSGEELDAFLSVPISSFNQTWEVLNDSYRKIFNHRAKFGIKLFKSCKSLRVMRGEEWNMTQISHIDEDPAEAYEHIIIFVQGSMLKFDFPDNQAIDGWVLKFENALSFAAWDNEEAINGMIDLAKDIETCKIAYALKYPDEMGKQRKWL